MAYKTYRYRRSSKRRTYRFSRYNLYRKRSAKAQSAQIYKLNKKMNKLKSDLSPDIKRSESSAYWELTGLSTLTTQRSTRLLNDVVSIYGNSVNVITYRGGKVYGSINFQHNKSGEESSTSLVSHSGSVRLIIYKLKSERPNFDIQINDILDTSTYDLNTLRPLKEGVGSLVSIIADRTYKVSDDYETVNFKIKLPADTLTRVASTSNAFAGEYGLIAVCSGLNNSGTAQRQIRVNYGVVNYFNA